MHHEKVEFLLGMEIGDNFINTIEFKSMKWRKESFDHFNEKRGSIWHDSTSVRDKTLYYLGISHLFNPIKCTYKNATANGRHNGESLNVFFIPYYSGKKKSALTACIQYYIDYFDLWNKIKNK